MKHQNTDPYTQIQKQNPSSGYEILREVAGVQNLLTELEEKGL
jgi:hypothetical protein